MFLLFLKIKYTSINYLSYFDYCFQQLTTNSDVFNAFSEKNHPSLSGMVFLIENVIYIPKILSK